MQHNFIKTLFQTLANQVFFNYGNMQVQCPSRLPQVKIGMLCHLDISMSNGADPRPLKRHTKNAHRELTFIVSERHEIFIGKFNPAARYFKLESVLADHHWTHDGSHDSCWPESVGNAVFKAQCDMHKELYDDLIHDMQPAMAQCDYFMEFNLGSRNNLFQIVELETTPDVQKNNVNRVGDNYWKQLVAITPLIHDLQVKRRAEKTMPNKEEYS